MDSLLNRRRFVGLAATATASAFIGAGLVGCDGDTNEAGSGAGSGATPSAEIDYADWAAVLEAAKGQQVSWYGWGGSEPRNTWINTVLAPALKETYGITLNLVGMGIDEVLTQLSGEIQAGAKTGTIDFIWINGENFFSAKANGYLWGPFCSYLPNFNTYIDAKDPEAAYDFGEPVEGFEAPYGKAQMQMWYDSARGIKPPADPADFLEFCKANPGKVTYPEPGDFVGTAFISCLIAGVVGVEKFEQLSRMQSPTSDEVKVIIEPGLEYLRSLNPHLWKQGSTFPADSPTLETMYADGELIMSMGYGAPEALVKSGTLPNTTRSFLFDTGTVGNSNFMAIAINAPHKAAALVAINEVMSPQMQLSQYEALATISVLDRDLLSADEKAQFDAVPLGVTQLPLAQLLDHRVSEAAGPVIPLMEKLWHDEVFGK